MKNTETNCPAWVNSQPVDSAKNIDDAIHAINHMIWKKDFYENKKIVINEIESGHKGRCECGEANAVYFKGNDFLAAAVICETCGGEPEILEK